MKIIAKINVEYDKTKMVKETQNVYKEVPLMDVNKVLHDAKMNAIAGLGLSECHNYFDIKLVRDIESYNNSEMVRYMIYYDDKDVVGNIYITYEVV